MNHRHLTSLAALPILLSLSAARAETKPLPQAPADAPDAAKKEPPPATSKWKTSFYGFIEFDAMRDSTQSFGDGVGNSPILRSDGSIPAYLPLGTSPQVGPTDASTHPRLQATARNSRFGFKISPPEYAGITATGVLELDFIGNQPSNPPSTSESSFFTNATPRVRHAYAKAESDVVDVLFGQYYTLFGWQPLYFPATVSFLGIPNMVFGRTPQLRISKTIRTDPIDFQLGLAALRPPQRDSGFPDLQGGLRFGINGWKGAHGAGSGQATIDALSIGVSAALRKFRVAEFFNNAGDPTVATKVAQANGYGVSIDALIPIIPPSSLEDKGNSLTLTGSYVTGAGIGDLFTGGLTGGAHFPLPEGPAGPNTGIYVGNIDPGLVQYSLIQTPEGQKGVLRVLKWQAYMVGLQYFLPPTGKVILAGNYSRGKSSNIEQTIDDGGDPSRTFKQSEYFDVNLFADITPAIRAALSFQRVQQVFVQDDAKEKNDRFEIAGYFFF